MRVRAERNSRGGAAAHLVNQALPTLDCSKASRVDAACSGRRRRQDDAMRARVVVTKGFTAALSLLRRCKPVVA